MKIASWPRVGTLFEAALALAPDEVPAFLARACPDEPEVRAEVERLLALDRGAGEAFEREDVLRSVLWLPRPGSRIGEFTVVRAIGAGGMGTVFEALQERPRRTVALKTLRTGLATRAHVQRFAYETETLGRLRHPAIAQIYAAGTHEEQGEHFPYFAMELVPGARDVLRYARDDHLPLAARLELLAAVSEAVHHAHQKGVIHRDLKAENILVDAEGRPKVIDFGVALGVGLAEDHRATRVGDLVGTLATMSPEQLGGDLHEIDARTDVYSLGVVLWELVAGEPPYELAGLPICEAVRRVRESLPRPPAHVPRELRWVLARALEKDPGRRYASASELGLELRRFLAHEPVVAGPPGVRYRAAKLARRHRVPLIALAAVVVALAAGLLRASASARAESLARAVADAGARRARLVSGSLEHILGSIGPVREGRDVSLEAVLEEADEAVAEVAAQDPGAGAALHKMIGRSYVALHRLADAEIHLTAASILAERNLDPDDPLAIAIEAAWAEYRIAERAPVKALEIAREALPRAERVLGPHDAETYSLRSSLTEALLALDRLDEAESVTRETLRARRAVQERGTWEIPILLQLARVAMRRDTPQALEESRRLAGEALARCEELLPPGHFHAVAARQILAMVAMHDDAGDELADFAAAVSDGAPGLRHSDCIALAKAMQVGLESSRAGDHERSRAAFESARAAADSMLGRDSLASIQARNGVALACIELGRHEEARRLSDEALDAARRTLPPGHRTTLCVSATSALAAARRGEPRAAIERFRDVLRASDEGNPPDDPLALDVLVAMADAAASAADRATLEEIARELAERAPEDAERAGHVREHLAALAAGG